MPASVTEESLRERNILRTPPPGSGRYRRFVAPLPQPDPHRLAHPRTLDRAHAHYTTGY
jgi:hypothetical protein